MQPFYPLADIISEGSNRRYRIMKKLISGVLAFLLVCMSLPASAVPVRKYGKDLYYSVNQDNTITIRRCGDEARSVVIPDEIDGMKVTKIGDGAFCRCYDLESVSIGGNVTEIGFLAFELCTSLTSVTIPDSVTSIGEDAFVCCSALESVEIGSGITEIGERTFHLCKKLSSVNIPDNVSVIGAQAFMECYDLRDVDLNRVTSIGSEAFESCALERVDIPASVSFIGRDAFMEYDGLSEIAVSPDNEYFCSKDGILFSKDGTELIVYPPLRQGKSYLVPDGVEYIDNEAFANCREIEGVSIPDSVKKTGERVFWRCTSLKEITLPEGIESIEYGTFFACEALENVMIPDSVTSIGEDAFDNCRALESFDISDRITDVGSFAFSGSGLKSVTVPGSIEKLGFRVFEDCEKLEDVRIAEGVREIGRGCFKGCYSLKDVSLPKGLERIDVEAFAVCDALESINIPESIKYIGAGAFAKCGKVFSVYEGSDEQLKAVTVEERNDELRLGEIRLMLNGDYLMTDVKPYIENGRTMVPVRVISEGLNASVSWDADKRETGITSGSDEVILKIGSPAAYINGRKTALDAAPVIKDDRTFVPLRLVTEALGCDIKWDAEKRTVRITDRNNG